MKTCSNAEVSRAMEKNLRVQVVDVKRLEF